MPIYRNNSTTKAKVLGDVIFPPGTTQESKIYAIDDPDLELLEHGESPVKKLHAGALPVSIASGLAKYGTVTIDNATDAIVTGYFNGDNTNTWVVMPGAFKSFEYDKSVDALNITGSGAGNVYVNGIEKD